MGYRTKASKPGEETDGEKKSGSYQRLHPHYCVLNIRQRLKTQTIPAYMQVSNTDAALISIHTTLLKMHITSPFNAYDAVLVITQHL